MILTIGKCKVLVQDRLLNRWRYLGKVRIVAMLFLNISFQLVQTNPLAELESHVEIHVSALVECMTLNNINPSLWVGNTSIGQQ